MVQDQRIAITPRWKGAKNCLNANATASPSLAGIRVNWQHGGIVNISDRQQIDAELSGLIALRTEFFQKRDPTAADVQEFEQSGRRIRELFAQLAQMIQAA